MGDGPCRRERSTLASSFRCRPVTGDARVNDEESLAVGWYRPEALPDLDAVDRLRLDTALDDGAPAWFAVPGQGYDGLPPAKFSATG